MSDNLMPSTRRLINTVEKNMPGQQTPEFTRLREDILDAQVCTSLSDEDATERMNQIPSGTTGGWQLSTRPGAQPVACADRPNTHRHLIFDC